MIVNYSKFRAFVAAAVPIFLILFLLVDVSRKGSFYLHIQDREYVGPSMIIIGIFWWLYSIGFDGCKFLFTKFNTVEVSGRKITLPDGRFFHLDHVKSLKIVKSPLKKETVKIYSEKGEFYIKTLFQKFGHAKTAQEIINDIIGVGRTDIDQGASHRAGPE